MAKYEITLGLAKHKTAYFDRETNTSFSIQNQVRKIAYDTYEQIASIIDDLLTRHPSLVYYNGDLPDTFIDQYLKSYPMVPEGATMTARAHGEMNMRIISANNMDVRAKELKDQVKAAAAKVDSKEKASKKEVKEDTAEEETAQQEEVQAKARTTRTSSKTTKTTAKKEESVEEKAKEAASEKGEATEEQGSLL